MCSRMSFRNPALADPTLFKKAVGYRVLSILVTTLIAFAIVGDLALATNIGIGANVVKFLLYYAYELAWAGRVGPG